MRAFFSSEANVLPALTRDEKISFYLIFNIFSSFFLFTHRDLIRLNYLYTAVMRVEMRWESQSARLYTQVYVTRVDR